MEAGARQRRPDERFCRDCGEVISQAAEICPKCGVRQFPAQGPFAFGFAVTPSGKSQLAAALLGIVLGSFGVHKFYLGQIGWGIIYLVFFWTLVPGIVGFVEGIILLTMPSGEFLARFGHA
ncbi:MAG: TM2 domain-containing protein [Terriglobales bacterium]